MAQRSLKIIVVLFFAACPLFLQAQKIVQQPKTILQIVEKLNPEQQRSIYGYIPLILRNEAPGVGRISNLQPVVSIIDALHPDWGPYYSFHLNPGYYNQSLGFFCQKELQIQKFTNVPFRFRLGSLDFVNWMEQKPNAVKPK